MDRRTFTEAMTASMLAAPLGVFAHQAAIVRKIGVLAVDGPRTQAEQSEEAEPLQALGWVEGKNLLVERRYVSGRSDLLRPSAEELVRLKVELIGTLGTPAALAAKAATRTVPIVIWSAGDVIGAGLVQSLSRPGGNVTGLSLVGPELDAKRLAVLRGLFPGLRRVGMLVDAANPYERYARARFEQTCQSVGIQPMFGDLSSERDLESTIAEVAGRRAQALVVPWGGLYQVHTVRIINAARTYSLPILAYDSRMLTAGAFVSYTYDGREQDQRYASFVDRILRGAKPADLPMEQPTKFELGINLRTAKALGLVVPQSILLQANQVLD